LPEEIVNTTMIFETNEKVIGIDVDEFTVITASAHDVGKQIIHMSNGKTTEEERFNILVNPQIPAISMYSITIILVINVIYCLSIEESM
jgi:hypothetical protein